MPDYRFHVTIHTDDIAALHCLRGLVHHCQQVGSDKMKAWANTGKDEWLADGHKVTFGFSKPSYRSNFIVEAERLLPTHWTKVAESDGAT